jgi:hypothetical protein
MSRKDLYILGEKLGLNKDDIENILTYELVLDAQANLSCGPHYSGGALYGTISPYDF